MLFTFIFGTCVLIAMWVYGKELIYKENPLTLYSEKYSKHPERFDLKKNKFQFM